MAKRRTEEAQPRGAYKPMQSPPVQRAVGSPQSPGPQVGVDVEIPQSPVRAAAARRSQEATQPAPNAPAPMPQDTPPRLSQRPTQPMEFALTPTKDKGIAGKTPPRHSEETTQPATSQLVDLYTQYRERHDNEEELITEWMTRYQQTGKGQSTASSTDNQLVLVSVASAQYQQTGECRMAHIVDTAQPTHLISSTEDAVMQLSPDTPRSDAQIATPRQSIGGRCRKWVVSTQDSSSTNKRACAACTICSKQFTPGEHRLQQWSIRDAHRSYVHAHCIKGGLKTSHEFIPKNSKDIDAKEGVLHLRNNVLNAATETGIVLPIYDPHEDNSTVAPDDEDRTFDREEALGLDDAIMDFHWFSSVSWTDIKDLRGTTYVQPPTRLRFALQQAQHAILRAIMHHGPSSPDSESAWKVLILNSWLLLGRPAENASDANCANYMEAGLDLFWSEEWPALWAMVRAECDVTTATQKRTRTKGRTNRNQDSQGCHSRQSWGEKTSTSSGTKRPASPSHPGHSPGDQEPLPRGPGPGHPVE